MNSRVIAEFQKNSAEFVRISLSEFKGSLYFDLRIWLQEKPAEPGNLKPTKKGLCLSVDLLDDLRGSLEKLARIVNEGENG